MPMPPTSPQDLIRLERFEIDTPLGLRFWDPVTGKCVSDGLIVTAYRAHRPDWIMMATANHSSVFVFHALSALSEPGSKSGRESSPPAAPLQVWGLIVTVRDQLGQFQPFKFSITEPTRGLFDWTSMDFSLIDSPVAALEGRPVLAVPLFSTAARHIPAGLAVVRADLRQVLPSDENGLKASWAVMDVLYKGKTVGRGVADSEGRVAVVLPYPPPAISSTVSGSPTPTLPLWQQSWTIAIEVHFQTSDPEVKFPDLAEVLASPKVTPQDPCGLDGLPGVLSLVYGQDTIVSSLGKSELFFTNP
jgi:hypothetical protein